MGLFSGIGFAARVADGGWSSPKQLGLSSPWAAPTTLTKVALSDVFGAAPVTATRADAMRVPAVVKGRDLICGTLSRQPMAQYRDAERVDTARWLYWSAAQAPLVRMLWTLDDVIFYGASLWALEREGDTITDAVRVLPDEWEVDEDRRIKVRGSAQSAEQVMLIEGPQEGLCDIAAEDIHASINMRRAWSKRVDHPVPLMALKVASVQDFNLTDDEVQGTVDDWDKARREGGTAFLPAGLGLETPGVGSTDLFVEGRNAARLDIANYLNLPGSLLDGSTATASLTYSTKEGARNELIDYSLAYWATPIEARLSQDDVCPPGERVEFDVSYLATPTQPTQGPARED